MDERMEQIMPEQSESEKLKQALVGEIMTMDWVIEELGEDWRLKEDAPTLQELRAGLMARLEQLEQAETA